MSMTSRATIARVILALVILALAPETASAKGQKELVLWHAYRAKERSALEVTITRWNEGGRGKNPRIRLLAVPFDAFADKITAAIPRGHGPDLFIFAHDRVGDWAESKVVEPIEFWMTEKHADRFLFKSIDALCYGDSLFGLPMAFKSTVLFYNKDLVPNPPKTTDELLAIGKKLTDRKQGRFGLVYDNTKLYFHSPWLFGFGGAIFDKDGKTLRINTPQAAAALRFAQLLGGKEGIVPPESSATLTVSLFNNGKAAMAISGPWMIGELSSKLKVGVIPLPVVSSTKKRAGPFLGVEGVMMSAKSKMKPAAFAAMKFLTNDKMALIRALSARQPVANVAVWKKKRVRNDLTLAAFRKQFDWAAPLAGIPRMRVVWSPYDMALQKVVGRNGDPKAALAEAAKEIARFIAARKRSSKKTKK